MSKLTFNESITDSSDSDDDILDENFKKISSEKISPQPTTAMPQQEDEQNGKVSKFLKSFLSTKRKSDVVAPIEIEAFNDKFIREFLTVPSESPSLTSGDDSLLSQPVISSEIEKEMKKELEKEIEKSENSLQQMEEITTTDFESETTNGVFDSNHVIKLMNLPYKVSESDVSL